ncbi:hypothetical protein BTA35_0216855, partial [Oceanospirillum linum]
ALVLQMGNAVEAEDLCIEVVSMNDRSAHSSSERELQGPVAVEASVVSSVTLPDSVRLSESGRLGDDLQIKEFEMILAVLKESHGRKNKAADRLGISPRTLRYKLAKMREHGIDVEKVVDLM